MTPRLTLFAVFIAVLFGAAPAPAPAQYSHQDLLEMEKTVQGVVRKARPTVITIIGRTEGAQGSGSATIISKDGLLLTAAHVIGQNEEMEVIFADGTRGKAKSLGCYFGRDIALAQLEGEGPWPFAKLGDSRSVDVAEIFIAMGHAGGYDKDRPAPPRIGRSYNTGKSRFLITDCTLIGGDSGGPLFNLKGEVIGVNSSIGGSLSQNNHAPVHLAQDNWDRLLKGEKWGNGPGSKKTPELDLTEGGPALGVHFKEDEDAMVITRIVEGSAAAKAGLQTGDVIIRLGIRATPDRDAFFSAFANFKAGQKVAVAVTRKGKVKILYVTLGKYGETFDKPSSMEPVAPLHVAAPVEFDEEAFARFMQKKAIDSGGNLKMGLEGLREALQEFGLSEGEVGRMSDQKLIDLAVGSLSKVGEVRKNGTPIEPESAPQDRMPEPTQDGPENGEKKENEKSEDKPKEDPDFPNPARVNSKSLGAALAKEIQKVGPDFELTPKIARRLLEGAGADPKALGEMTDNEALDYFFGKLRSSGMPGFGMPGVSSADYDKLDTQFEGLLAGHAPAIKSARYSTVGFVDEKDQPLVLGAVIDGRGFAISKASELRDDDGPIQIRCLLNDGKTVGAEVVKTWDEHDLALVRIDALDLPAIQWHQGDLPEVGSFLTAPSVGMEDPIAIGLLSVEPRAIPQRNKGFLGIVVEEAETGVGIRAVLPDSAADKAQLQAGDVVLELDGEAVDEIKDFIDRVGGRKPGAELRILVQRGKKKSSYKVELGKKPEDERYARMNKMGTEISKVDSGFASVFQHDLPLRPSEVGGPIVDLKGRAIGLNIARGGRIKSFALPAKEILAALAGVDLHRLTEATTKPEPKAAPLADGPGKGETEDAIAELMRALDEAQDANAAARSALDAAQKDARKAVGALD